ncbi:hypothetical protein [Curtobacterium sp. MCLR17_054]|uniref:hypothetical protein n=1 Tax=Curtobacterium sp. MCLR17_054 TaxID=2175632 RepID=UPI0011B51FD8|nr:hypothetical protein [Curtobacterium sp. MCLR17_054]WIE70310.1 hypothetical protein DEJ08_018210 [Curtobacterium sp. MCLR17_054]
MLLAGIGGTLGVSTTASAAPLTTVSCTIGQEHQTYSPGLTLTPAIQQSTTTSQYGPCVGLGDSTGGSAKIDSSKPTQKPISCLSLLQTASGQYTIKWANGKTSTWQWNLMVNQASSGFTRVQSGKITSGLFAGSTATRISTGTGNDLNQILGCATGGAPVTSATYASTLLISPLPL